MSVSQHVWNTLANELDKVLALDVPEITELAKKIAFYDAMIDAATDDPLDDPEHQDELMQFFTEVRSELLSTYQELVNEQM